MMKIKKPQTMFEAHMLYSHNLNRSVIIQLKVMSTNMYKYMMIRKEKHSEQANREQANSSGGPRKPVVEVWGSQAVAGAT